MAQDSLPWGGTVTGDAGPYTDDNWSDMFRKLFTTDRTVQGVVRDYLNELEVSNPAGLTIRVQTGAAMVDGKFYENTANVDNAGAAPGAGSNYYTVVLQKLFAAQTVRVAILGPNVVAPPAVTQVDGATWEISLATVEITSGSVVTVTDTRNYIQMAQESHTNNILAANVTEPKLALPVRWVRLFESELGAPGTFDFNGISQDYRVIKIIGSIRSTASGGGLASDGVHIRFNADAGANYDWGDYLYDFTSPVLATSLRNTNEIEGGAVAPDDNAAGCFSPIEITITNYSNTNQHKGLQMMSSHIYNGGVQYIGWCITHGIWKSTAGISRVTITAETAPNTFEADSILSLYAMP